jgi:hypothetical protein
MLAAAARRAAGGSNMAHVEGPVPLNTADVQVREGFATLTCGICKNVESV